MSTASLASNETGLTDVPSLGSAVRDSAETVR
jgi:hypothetical protein